TKKVCLQRNGFLFFRQKARRKREAPDPRTHQYVLRRATEGIIVERNNLITSPRTQLACFQETSLPYTKNE
ncbi:jg2070, partial [Pararge aegeria aegeria]